MIIVLNEFFIFSLLLFYIFIIFILHPKNKKTVFETNG